MSDDTDALAALTAWVRDTTLAWARAERAMGTDASVVEAERQRAEALLAEVRQQCERAARDSARLEWVRAHGQPNAYVAGVFGYREAIDRELERDR